MGVSLFGVEIDELDMLGSVDQIMEWLDEIETEDAWDDAESSSSNGPNETGVSGESKTSESACRYIVTPNVDHVVMLQSNEELKAAYADAAMVVADGFPLIVASKLLGSPLPERVAGSELVEVFFNHLADRDGNKTRVYLLGAMPGVADRAATRVQERWPHVDVVGTHSPPFGFEHSDEESSEILRRIEEADPEVVIFGVGAPKQELWTHRFQDRLDGRVVFCVGATIDFLAGEKPQAPVWMRRSGLEWLHRCASEPKRLAKRYAKGAIVFPQIVFREWLSKANKS